MQLVRVMTSLSNGSRNARAATWRVSLCRLQVSEHMQKLRDNLTHRTVGNEDDRVVVRCYVRLLARLSRHAASARSA
jgi:hypothetical protein